MITYTDKDQDPSRVMNNPSATIHGTAWHFDVTMSKPKDAAIAVILGSDPNPQTNKVEGSVTCRLYEDGRLLTEQTESSADMAEPMEAPGVQCYAIYVLH